MDIQVVRIALWYAVTKCTGAMYPIHVVHCKLVTSSTRYGNSYNDDSYNDDSYNDDAYTDDAYTDDAYTDDSYISI